MANSHPGSYCGQDAYSDMFVTERRNVHELGRHTDRSHIDTEQLWGGQRMPDKENFNCVIGETKGGDAMKEVSTVVRRLTPT